MKGFIFILLVLFSALQLNAQGTNCVFKEPSVTIHFGSGTVTEVNSPMPTNYSRVGRSCPTDGHYTYTSYTSDCFRGDWITINEDHTPGDADGNMMIVNASPNSGSFFNTTVSGLKGGMIYQFGVWMMNVCKPSDKCPFPLLPNITVRLATKSGKLVAQFNSGDLARRDVPHWTPYKAEFKMPAGETALTLMMTDNAPGGCGNDFALDDITFRECEKPVTKVTRPPAVVKPKPKTPVVAKQQPKSPPVRKPQTTISKPRVTKATTERPPQNSRVGTLQPDSIARAVPVPKQRKISFPPPPTVLVTRANPVIKKIETGVGEIILNLYDNGQIDGDTISIYHNNRLVVSRARLSIKPITFRIAVDPEHPHHELVMVAENLGSIPPNTSVMIVTSATDRHEVFISSSDQKNAKVVIDLRKNYE